MTAANSTTQPQSSQVKLNLAPVIITTFVGTVVAVAATYFATVAIEKRKAALAEKAEKEKQDAAMLNPSMPMMWPGMGMNGGHAALRNPDDLDASFSKMLSRMEEKMDRSLDQRIEAKLSQWEEAAEKEAAEEERRAKALRLVMGGEDEY